MLGIAFADQLLHGWDLAVATGQDATMPEGLPAMAYGMIHGRFTDEQRTGVFKPEVTCAGRRIAPGSTAGLYRTATSATPEVAWGVLIGPWRIARSGCRTTTLGLRRNRTTGIPYRTDARSLATSSYSS